MIVLCGVISISLHPVLYITSSNSLHLTCIPLFCLNWIVLKSLLSQQYFFFSFSLACLQKSSDASAFRSHLWFYRQWGCQVHKGSSLTSRFSVSSYDNLLFLVKELLQLLWLHITQVLFLLQMFLEGSNSVSHSTGAGAVYRKTVIFYTVEWLLRWATCVVLKSKSKFNNTSALIVSWNGSAFSHEQTH